MTVLVNRGTVLVGLRSPRALVIDVEPSDDVPDLSTVTDASLRVYRAAGVIESWTCAMSLQTATTLRLTHPWVVGDNDTVGEGLRIYPQLTIAGLVNEAQVCIVSVTAR